MDNFIYQFDCAAFNTAPGTQSVSTHLAVQLSALHQSVHSLTCTFILLHYIYIVS